MKPNQLLIFKEQVENLQRIKEIAEKISKAYISALE
jgi:hypothetical protein